MLDAYILVVEDDPIIRDLVTEVLSDEGYRVLAVEDGVDALLTLEASQPGLILLDLQLPGLDGRSFAREIRRRGFDVPLLVISALPNLWQTASEIGAVGYCPKPFDLDSLLDAIGTLMHPPPPARSNGLPDACA